MILDHFSYTVAAVSGGVALNDQQMDKVWSLKCCCVDELHPCDFSLFFFWFNPIRCQMSFLFLYHHWRIFLRSGSFEIQWSQSEQHLMWFKLELQTNALIESGIKMSFFILKEVELCFPELRPMVFWGEGMDMSPLAGIHESVESMRWWIVDAWFWGWPLEIYRACGVMHAVAYTGHWVE